MTITWLSPAVPKLCAVVAYTLRLQRQGRVSPPTLLHNVTSTRHVWRGLPPGAQFTVAVVATNAAGTGPWSAPCAPVSTSVPFLVTPAWVAALVGAGAVLLCVLACALDCRWRCRVYRAAVRARHSGPLPCMWWCATCRCRCVRLALVAAPPLDDEYTQLAGEGEEVAGGMQGSGSMHPSGARTIGSTVSANASVNNSHVQEPESEPEEGVSGAREAVAAGTLPTQYRSLYTLVLCLFRLVFPTIVTTLFYAIDPRKRHVLWLQVASIGVGLVLGVTTVGWCLW